jgi:hypothetical protein
MFGMDCYAGPTSFAPNEMMLTATGEAFQLQLMIVIMNLSPELAGKAEPSVV